MATLTGPGLSLRALEFWSQVLVDSVFSMLHGKQGCLQNR
jgi:hypothetical protein